MCLLGVEVKVDDSVSYKVNENEGSINIFVLLDQPSCRPIIVTASPQAATATGMIVLYVHKYLTKNVHTLFKFQLIKSTRFLRLIRMRLRTVLLSSQIYICMYMPFPVDL